MVRLLRRIWRFCNWPMVVSAALLLAYGVAYINSACAIRDGAVRFLYLKQLLHWIPAGLILHIAIAAIPWRKTVAWSAIPYIAVTLALAVTLIPGIGTERFNARRWLFGFQPSEFAKLAIIPFTVFLIGRIRFHVAGRNKLIASLGGAARDSEIARPVNGWRKGGGEGEPKMSAGRAASLRIARHQLLTSAILVMIPIALIVMQPDLSTSVVIAASAVAIVFVSGIAPRAILATLATALVAGTVFISAIIIPEVAPVSPETREKMVAAADKIVLFNHWRERVLAFAFPERDPLDTGWNKTQSEIAVGSGGAWGKGYKNGTQNILGFLPRSVSPSDFIFSVIAEEAGFYGGGLPILLLFAALFGSIAWTAFRCRDTEGRQVCAGVATILFIHTFVNLAMTIGLVPVTGLPLPLVSYGGSFTIATLGLLGLVQSVHRHPA